jgi:hypothetical protein
LIRHYQPPAQFGVRFGVRMRQLYRFLPTRPTFKAFAVSQIRFCEFHGMEEVVGSIPTRSTKSPNNLDGASRRSGGICVVTCVVTRRFGAHSATALLCQSPLPFGGALQGRR